MPLRRFAVRTGAEEGALARLSARVTLPRAIIVIAVTAVAIAFRWFVRVANQAPGRSREPRPRSVADHRDLR
jgi:hypothetical protein